MILLLSYFLASKPTQYRSGSSITFKTLVVWPQPVILLPHPYTILWKTGILYHSKAILISVVLNLFVYIPLTLNAFFLMSAPFETIQPEGIMMCFMKSRNPLQTFPYMCIFFPEKELILPLDSNKKSINLPKVKLI